MVDKQVVRRGYDAITDTYAETRTDDSSDVTVCERFLDELEAGDRLLDAGCGQGIPVPARASESIDAVGIDLSRGQLEAARANAPLTSLTQGDMTRLPFAGDAFDAVTAYYSLIHVPEGEHQTVLDEFARVLRPGGQALVVEGTSEWHGTNPDWLDTGREMQWHIVGPEVTREQLQAAGFEVADEHLVGDGLDEDATWQVFEARLDG